MTDWATISSLATGGGTLILAVATFASVRSANRSARVAEQALQEQRRPVLAQSRLEDPLQKIMFRDGHWVHVGGSRAVAEQENGVVYLSMSLRNVGSGIAVLQGWTARPGLTTGDVDRAAVQELRSQTRDLYVPGGDIGLWQGALRDRSDPRYSAISRAIAERSPFTIELLYSDQVGGQRTISRFTITPMQNGEWMSHVGRHWYLEGPAPR